MSLWMMTSTTGISMQYKRRRILSGPEAPRMAVQRTNMGQQDDRSPLQTLVHRRRTLQDSNNALKTKKGPSASSRKGPLRIGLHRLKIVHAISTTLAQETPVENAQSAFNGAENTKYGSG